REGRDVVPARRHHAPPRSGWCWWWFRTESGIPEFVKKGSLLIGDEFFRSSVMVKMVQIVRCECWERV
uniref:Uncharacterized protein n=1 Tax=Anopheles arabiensis TaxID=7173 RepID=A0A182I308_ANOAR